jgi:energy-converting hydrogenase A subunit M
MKLELKHLAPYLPYGLDCYFTRNVKEENRIQKLISVLNIKENPCANLIHPLHQVKPILRPLSDLISLINIDFEDEKFKPIDVIIRKGGCHSAVALHVKIGKGTLGFKYFDLLLQWHFDVFGLIEKRLAIDINTIAS